MILAWWRKRMRTAFQSRSSVQDRHTHLSLEALEDRTVPSLVAGGTLPVNGTPNAVAVGDFNHDGKLDLITASANGGVSVVLNNGDGTFQTARNSPGPFAEAVAVGDFNGDGNIDAATVGGNSNLTVYFGNGDGTFASFTSNFIPSSVNLAAIAVGDFNNDHQLDIVVADPGTTANAGQFIYVAPNLGGGRFTFFEQMKVGKGPDAVAVADMNHDGFPDILTANRQDGTASELLDTSNGIFQGLRSFGVGTAPVAVQAADINGDGNLDLIAGLAGGKVNVLTGKGDGSFSGNNPVAIGANLTSFAVGDLNGDGKLDIVATDSVNSTVNVLPGYGNGTFAPVESFATGTDPVSLAVADFNGDGRTDVVTAGGIGLSLLLNDGLWSALPPPGSGGGGGGGGSGGGGIG